ncbi:MAG: radical SAM protein [Clostridia bacterium]|nr:radical SAM protein [Clostridia bacterium]
MKCTICPRLCGADRNGGERGYCGADGSLKVARAALHMWEEPPISGERGSGTVFFSHCPLKCVYCQNRDISSGGDGLVISVDRLCEIFFELKEKGAHNINLVSPTQYTNEIIAAVKTAKSRGFDLPFVYNTSGYERVETLQKFRGLIDIYLTDFKYMSPDAAKIYSNAADYPNVAESALREMMRQQPTCVFDGELMQSGVIVRHLILPGNIGDSKDVVDIFSDICGSHACLSLMRQYTPPKNCTFAEISRPITDGEYDEVVNYALMCGIKNMFLQDGESVSESFIPAFDYEGVLKNGT